MGAIHIWANLILAAATPGAVPQTAPAELAISAQTKAEPCSPAAIRQAVDRRQVPAVTGCRYDAVSGPLMSLHILPLPEPVDNDAARGVIVTQKPQAGTLAKVGLLVLQVSQGPKAASQASASESTVAVSSTSASSESKASYSQSQAPVGAVSSSAASGQSSSVLSSASLSSAVTAPGLGDSAGQLWSAIAAYPLPAVIAVALASLLAALGLRRKSPKMGAAPRVHCDLQPGPSRLVVKGALILGRKGDAR